MKHAVGIQVTLFKNADDGDTTQDIGGQTGGKVVSLTDRQKEVFKYIVEEPTISRSKLVKRMGINPSAVQKHIEALKKKGYIIREMAKQ
ncbi:winged helix-turn-helix transcriptional regulator [Mangrovibacterium sp.]|uniref:LexA family protein n=1 Tax=Mangrovibacterium sp. TaxID=1961364 RepID=UPI003564F351